MLSWLSLLLVPRDVKIILVLGCSPPFFHFNFVSSQVHFPLGSLFGKKEIGSHPLWILSFFDNRKSVLQRLLTADPP